MSSNNWSIIVPQKGVNLIRNPIAGGASGFSAVASATVTRVTTYQRFGRWSYKVDYTASGDGIQFNLSASLVSGTKYYFTAWAETTNGASGSLALDNGTDTQALAAIATYGDWTLYGAELANTSTASAINLERSAAGTGTYYIDGVQLEELAASGDPYTTLIHGDLEGDYRWLGEPHNSGSYRGALEYSGGIVKPLGAGAAPVTGFGMTINREAGAGAAPITVNAQPQALVDGDLTTGVNVLPRFLSIGGRLKTDDLADWHAKRRALVRALNNRLAPVSAQHAPRRLRYTGSGDALEIDVYYESGLEGAASTDATSSNKVTSEEIELRLRAPQPSFEAHGERAVTLDVNDGQTMRLLSGRVLWPDQDRTNWSALGAANNPPSASGTYSSIRALCHTSNGYIWIGGDFQNYDNIANADRLVRYRPDEWLTPFDTVAAGANNIVHAIAEGANGNIYIGGAFTTLGGGACNYYGVWNGSAITNVQQPSSGGGTVYAIAVNNAGDQWVGGDFTNWDATSANYITYWDESASAWVRPSANDPNGIVRAIAVAPDGTVYIGGEFTTAGGVTVNRVAYWDGSDWAAMGSGMNGIVWALETDDAGNVYAAGSFTTAGGATANRVAKWNGSGWLPLGGGLGGAAYALKYEAGTLYVGGVFTTAGGYTVTGAAAWSGSDWLPLDIDIPSATVYAIEAVGQDLYLGHNVNGAVTFAGDTGVTYAGTAPAYPIITIERSGGTSARAVSIRNDANGAQLFLNYELLDGEELTIDTRPNRIAVTSNLRGNRYAELSKLSDIGDFSLVPGPDGSLTQAIYAFVDTVGSPTMTAYMTYKEAYNGTD